MEQQMQRSWYYVKNNNTVGPVKENELLRLLKEKNINLETYLWTQGELEWKKGHEYNTIKEKIATPISEPCAIVWTQIAPQTQIIFVKAKDGNFFGPFSLVMLENLYKQKRIHAYDQIIIPGMDTWEVLYKAFPKSFALSTTSKAPSNYDCYEDVPVSARVKFLGESFWCLVRDFSIGGAQILSSQLKVNRGDQLNIEIITPNAIQSIVQIPCKVGRVLNENLGYFLIFEKTPKQAQELLAQFNQF